MPHRALGRAGEREDRYARRHAAEQRCEAEEGDAAEKDLPSADAIGDRAGGKQKGCEAEDVGADYPFDVSEAGARSRAIVGSTTAVMLASSTVIAQPIDPASRTKDGL